MRILFFIALATFAIPMAAADEDLPAYGELETLVFPLKDVKAAESTLESSQIIEDLTKGLPVDFKTAFKIGSENLDQICNAYSEKYGESGYRRGRLLGASLREYKLHKWVWILQFQVVIRDDLDRQVEVVVTMNKKVEPSAGNLNFE